MLGVYVRALLGFQRQRARERGIPDGQAGSVTVIQRFGGGLNLNIHFHTLVLDGVFAESETGVLRFHPAPPPSDEEVARLLATIRARVRRLLARRGLEPQAVDLPPPDPLAEASLALAGIKSAWHDGTDHLLFEPLELLEKLAALIPRPRVNLVLYHGILAPHARWRHRVVASEGLPLLPGEPLADSAVPLLSEPLSKFPGKRRYCAWADLMRRAFDGRDQAHTAPTARTGKHINVEDPQVIRRILAHLGLPTEPSDPCPSRPPPGRTGDLFAAIPA